MRPLFGQRLYVFSFCCTEVIAESTDERVTLDLMFDAVPYSSASIFPAWAICSHSSKQERRMGSHDGALERGHKTSGPHGSVSIVADKASFSRSQLSLAALYAEARTCDFGGRISVMTLVPLLHAAITHSKVFHANRLRIEQSETAPNSTERRGKSTAR